MEDLAFVGYSAAVLEHYDLEMSAAVRDALALVENRDVHEIVTGSVHGSHQCAKYDHR